MSPVVSQHDYTVTVVGAGMAGLAACRTLVDGGVTNILLLEGQNRAGGRVCSVPIRKSTDVRWLELGAQWLHGEKNSLHNIAESNSLLSDITSEEGLGQYLQENSKEVKASLVAEISNVVAEILEDCEKFWSEYEKSVPDSVGSYLSERFQQYLDECKDTPEIKKIKMDLFEWHKRFQIIDNSCDDLNDLSAKSWGRYKFCGGTDYINFKAGYSSLVDRLVNELPNGVLRLNTPVISIAYNNCNNAISNGWINLGLSSNSSPPVVVTCEDGTEYRCQHIIVTSSLGYLKKHHQTLFKPVLPPKLYKSIENIGYATINKIFLVYDQPWWTKDQYGFQIIWSSDTNDAGQCKGIELLPEQIWTRDLSGFDVLPNIEGVLLGWVGGCGAVAVEQLSELEIGEHCTYLLRQLTKYQDIPLPSEVIRSCWHGNRFICGGYSHLTVKCDLCDRQNEFDYCKSSNSNCEEINDNDVDASPENLSSPVYVCTQYTTEHPAILIAGEATHTKYFSTTHGAFETGRQQANRILQFIEDSTCRVSN